MVRRVTQEQSKLVEDNFNLIYAVANKYYSGMSILFDYDEVISICSEGLVKAAICYDVTKNVKFSTFAYNVMKNNLLSIYNWQKQKRNNSILISLDEVQTDNDKNLSSVIPSEFNLENSFMQDHDVYMLYKYIYELSEEHKSIILLHLKGYTFEQISNKHNKSFAYTYSQYQKALNTLRDKFKLHRSDCDE